MAKTRQATRRSPAPPGRSRKAAAPPGGGPRLGEALVGLFRPEIIGLALILLAALAIPWLAPLSDTAPDLRDSLVEALGLGVFAAAALLAVWGWLLYRRSFPTTGVAWRRWLGGLAVAIFVLGLMSLYRPSWKIGAVDFSEVTAGGELGDDLVGGPLSFLIWLALGLGGAWMLWPRSMTSLAARSPDLWRGVVALRLPHHTWAATSATVRGTRWLFRSSRGEADEAMDRIGARNPFDTRHAPADDDDAAGFDLPAAALAARYDHRSAFDRVAALSEPSSGAGLPFEAARPLGTLTLPERPRGGIDVAEGQRLGEGGWRLPPHSLLKKGGQRDAAGVDNVRRAEVIVSTLASFGVDARVVEVSEGPTVTQFGIEPGWEIKTRTVPERGKDGRPVLDRDGRPKTRTEEVSRTRVRVNQLTSLANDLALALAAPSLRIQAPVPGKPVVGIEVPNHDASVVNLRAVIESPTYQRLSGRSKLAVALGQGVSGEPVVADLAKMPHLLIAGATGSGKSVCVNAIIASILMQDSPDDVRLVMIDPKRVELAPFAGVPHLAFSRIIIDLDEVPGALNAVVSEMEARYRRFSHLAVRNIESYNRHPNVIERLPYWVVVIDELADLMMSAPYEVERQICRLAQLARATGIHLIVATQRPSVDVVTGLIKANFPTRIAFAVSSQVDSRTILDHAGAEKLLGRGDMLFMATDAAQPKRLQGVFVSDQEIDALVGFWRKEAVQHRLPTFDHLIKEARERQAQEEAEGQRDALFERARELALEHTRVSTSMLQRRLRIGYPRAARLMDDLEAEGVVGSAEGGGSREVLVSAGEVEIDPAWNDRGAPSV